MTEKSILTNPDKIKDYEISIDSNGELFGRYSKDVTERDFENFYFLMRILGRTGKIAGNFDDATAKAISEKCKDYKVTIQDMQDNKQNDQL